jgi:hypothetical protein
LAALIVTIVITRQDRQHADQQAEHDRREARTTRRATVLTLIGDCRPNVILASIHRVNRGSFKRVNAKGAL